MVCLFERVGDHKGNWLAFMAFSFILEDVQPLTDSRVWGAFVQ